MIFKKILSLALSVAMVCGVLPVSASLAADTTDKAEISMAYYSETYVDGVYYAVYYDHAEVLDYDPSLSEVIIQDKVAGVPVTAIARFEEYYSKKQYPQITSLTLPESINTISGEYFTHLPSLQSIYVSSKNPYMTSIDGVLYSKDMNELICLPRASHNTEYTIPDTVTRIGDYAISSPMPEYLSIPDTVRFIGKNTYHSSNGIKLPESLEKIEYLYQFKDDSLIIPEEVRFLGECHFGTAPQEIVFYSPYCFIEGVDYIKSKTVIKGYDGSTAYEYANDHGYKFESLGAIPPQLKNTLHTEGPLTYIVYNDYAELLRCQEDYKGDVVISDMIDNVPVTEIHASAFRGCTSVKSISIPNTITEIGSDAFEYCLSITELTIPNGVKEIKASTFYKCRDLTSVTIPDSIERIELFAFDECVSLKEINIPSSVKYIEQFAFIRCEKLDSVSIPDSVVYIGDGVFNNTPWLENEQNKSQIVTINGILISGKTVSGSVEIPDSVTRIKSAAFAGCEDITSVVVPSSVWQIGNSAFANCTDLETITILNPKCRIGSGEKEFYISRTICNSSTNDDTEYTGVIKGYKDSTAEEYANKCGRTFVAIDAQEPTIINSGECGNEGDNLTWTLDSEGTLTISGTGKMKDYFAVMMENSESSPTPWYNKKEQITKIIIDDGITHIGDYAFYECAAAELSLPKSIVSIGNSAFYGCGINELALPENTSFVDRFAFAENHFLTKISMSTKMNVLSGYTFRGCDKLTEIVIPENIERIEEDVFSNCDALSSVTIENPQCIIFESESVFFSGKTAKNGAIKGYSKSTAEEYAKKYKITFIALDSPTTTTSTTQTTKPRTTTTTTSTATSSSTTTTTTTSTTTTTTSTTTTTTATTTTTTTSTTSTTTATTTTTTTSTAAETTSTAVTTTTTAVFEHGKDTWGFTNSATNFRKSGKLVLLESEEKRINDLKAIYNKHTMNAIIDEFINNPGGACYGMSLFDLVYMSDREKILPLVQEGAQDLHSIALTDEVRSMINYYSILQVVPEIQYEITTPENGNDDDKIEKLLTLLEDGPVLVCYQVRSDKNGKVYSHAVVAYDVEAYTPTESDSEDFLKSLNYTPGSDTMKVIKVYDPQYSKYSDNCNIYINTSKIAGKDVTLWSIKESYKYNDLTSKYIMLVSNNLDLLNKYGLFKDIANSKPDLEKKLQPKLTVTSMETDNGPLDWLLNINYENYKWIEGGAEDDHPYYVSSDFYGENPVNTNKFLLKYPYEGYSFDYEGESSTNTKMRTQYPDSIFDLEADKLKSASFNEDRMSFILDGKSLFKFSGISDKQSEKTDFYTVTIEGTASDKVECLYDGKGTWWVTSKSPLKDINISASNDNGNYTLQKYSATSSIITIKYSKQHDKISIGNEDDTSYVPENEFGDINDDSMIDAKDASMILIAYSKASTGDSDGLSHEQRSAADVNSDGKIDAKDASVILAYYSLVSTSGDNAQTLSEFVGSKEK